MAKSKTKKPIMMIAAESASDLYEREFYSKSFIGAGDIGAISTVNWYRSAVRAEKLAQQNGVYKRLLEVMRDNIFGGGIRKKVNVKEESLMDVEDSISASIDRSFFGKKNRCDLKVPGWIYERCMNGETCLPARVNKFDGSVDLGYIPARWISEVILSGRDITQAYAIKVQEGEWQFNKRNKDGGKMKWQGDGVPYRVIGYDREPYELNDDGKVKIDPETGEEIRNKDYGKLAGDAFYFRSGFLLGQKRGQGELFAMSDWVITLEQGIRDFLQRYDSQAALVYDLMVSGADEDEIKEKYGKIVLPTGRVPFVHNENVTLTLHSPNLRIEDLTNFIKTLVRLIAGTAGIPEYAMGDGSNTNVATAEEQAPVMYAKFTNRRSLYESEYELICRFIVQSANDAGQLYRTNKDGVKTTVRLTPEQLEQIEVGVVFLPFERTNQSEQADTAGKVIEAVKSMEEYGYIDHTNAAQIAQAVMRPYGLTVTSDAIRQQIKDELNEKAKMMGVGASGSEVDMSAVPQSLTLNGAQIGAATDITKAVSAGEISKESGLGLLTSMGLDEKVADKILSQLAG